jgi:acetate kinase
MDGADAVIFSGGIGENSAIIREKICAGLETIGLALDHEANQKTKPGDLSIITKPDSQVKAYVIPTNEELLIARDTVRVVKNAPRRW